MLQRDRDLTESEAGLERDIALRHRELRDAETLEDRQHAYRQLQKLLACRAPDAWPVTL